MKKVLYRSLFIAVLSAALFNSCKKADVDTETQSATDNTIAEAEFTAIMPATNSRAVQTNGIGKKETGAATGNGPYVQFVSDTASGTLWPRRIAFDFDRDAGNGALLANGTLDTDGKIRKGRLSMVYKYKWGFSGCSLVIDTMKNYSVNGVFYNADSITMRINSNTYSMGVYNGSCTDGVWHIKWSATRSYTFSGTGNTDVSVTGSASGTNRNGLSYTCNITSPIVKKASCEYISSGTIDLTPSGLATRTLDYSVDASGAHNNACDNSASLTIKGNTFIFKLE